MIDHIQPLRPLAIKPYGSLKQYPCMKIKLVGALPRELKDLGLKPGDQFDAQPAENTTLKAVQFFVWADEKFKCTVWPENYVEIK